jgi:hypothetical protein
VKDLVPALLECAQAIKLDRPTSAPVRDTTATTASGVAQSVTPWSIYREKQRGGHIGALVRLSHAHSCTTLGRCQTWLVLEAFARHHFSSYRYYPLSFNPQPKRGVLTQCSRLCSSARTAARRVQSKTVNTGTTLSLRVTFKMRLSRGMNAPLSQTNNHPPQGENKRIFCEVASLRSRLHYRHLDH